MFTIYCASPTEPKKAVTETQSLPFFGTFFTFILEMILFNNKFAAAPFNLENSVHVNWFLISFAGRRSLYCSDREAYCRSFVYKKKFVFVSCPCLVHTLTWRAYNLLERWIHFNGKKAFWKNCVLIKAAKAAISLCWCLSICLLSSIQDMRMCCYMCVNCNYITNWYFALFCSPSFSPRIFLSRLSFRFFFVRWISKSFHEIIDDKVTRPLMIQAGTEEVVLRAPRVSWAP